jgi:hypothetical protein
MIRMEIATRTPSQRAVKPLLEAIHEQLFPEDCDSVVAINTETGEFVLGADYGDAYRKFQERFPNAGRHICRVDGSPALHM